MKQEGIAPKQILDWTSEIVSAHIRNAALPSGELPEMIRAVHATLIALVANGAQDTPEPAVPVKRSVTPDYIICLEDGRKLKMLKRHLRTAYDMTPAQYRDKWQLPPDYPMVAPNYAKARSALARKIGLGRGRRKGSTKK
jgi:predicted transcriptional regulator